MGAPRSGLDIDSHQHVVEVAAVKPIDRLNKEIFMWGTPRRAAILVGIFTLSVGACSRPADKPADKPAPPAKIETGVVAGAASEAFRNAVNEPPAGWTGHIFTLSHSYPTTLPVPPSGGYPWESIDFKTAPANYMQAVLNYARADLEAYDWDPTRMPNPSWFHAPWMATGTNSGNGREFIRGMTKERASRAGELSPQQTTPFIANYAVGFYNDVGGWTFGRVWRDPGKPDISGGKANFANGAMAIKLLFTQADPAVPADGVPYLKNSKEWQANIARYSRAGPSVRQPQTLRLLQVDIAVRDKNNDDLTGWLMGTFVYNGNLPGNSPFDRLSPVGLMWGDSPGFLPADAAAGKTPPEQWINTNVGTYQHLGWARRINGPVDNPASSCMSCHGGGAESPVKSPMLPPKGASDQDKLAWFTNIQSGQARDAGSTSLDYSLQMSVAVQSWKKWLATQPGLQSTEINEYPVNRGDVSPDE
jgi:hypothetical protein